MRSEAIGVIKSTGYPVIVDPPRYGTDGHDKAPGYVTRAPCWPIPERSAGHAVLSTRWSRILVPKRFEFLSGDLTIIFEQFRQRAIAGWRNSATPTTI